MKNDAVETIVSNAIERVIDHPDLTAGTKSLLHEIVTALEFAEILPEGKVLVDVETAKFAVRAMDSDNNHTEAFLTGVLNQSGTKPDYLLKREQQVRELNAAIRAADKAMIEAGKDELSD